MKQDLISRNTAVSAELRSQSKPVIEAGAYTEANTMIEAADHLDCLGDLLARRARPALPFEDRTHQLPLRLRAYTGFSTPWGGTLGLAAEAIEEADREVLAFPATRKSLFDLSPAQTAMLFQQPRNEFRNTDATLDSLVRKGVYEKDRSTPTPRAIEHIWNGYECALDLLLTGEERRNAQIVRCDAELLQILKRPTKSHIDIYVYRGYRPMVVEGGDGQNPLAYLHPFYGWEIRSKRAGLFLKRNEITGWKSSYGYSLRETMAA